jgi:hypothetical protein
MAARQRSQSAEGLRFRRGPRRPIRGNIRCCSDPARQVDQQHRKVLLYEEAFLASIDLLRSHTERMKSAIYECPVWVRGKAPGTMIMEFASLGNITLYVAMLSKTQQRLSPGLASEYQWVLVSEAPECVSVGGGADSLDQAKGYAFRAYEAACGLDPRQTGLGQPSSNSSN